MGVHVHAADRLAKLREFRATGVNLRVPAAVGLLDAEIKQTSRGLHAGGNAESQEAQATIRSLAEGVVFLTWANTAISHADHRLSTEPLFVKCSQTTSRTHRLNHLHLRPCLSMFFIASHHKHLQVATSR